MKKLTGTSHVLETGVEVQLPVGVVCLRSDWRIHIDKKTHHFAFIKHGGKDRALQHALNFLYQQTVNQSPVGLLKSVTHTHSLYRTSSRPEWRLCVTYYDTLSKRFKTKTFYVGNDNTYKGNQQSVINRAMNLREESIRDYLQDYLQSIPIVHAKECVYANIE